MKTIGGVFFIGVGVLLLWLVASGKLDNIAQAWAVLTGASSATGSATGRSVTGSVTNSAAALAALPVLPMLPGLGMPGVPLMVS